MAAPFRRHTEMCISFLETGLFLGVNDCKCYSSWFSHSYYFSQTFFFPPCPSSAAPISPPCTPEKAEPAGIFRVKGKEQCCLIQVVSHRGVWVTNAVVWLPSRLCFPGKPLLGCSRSSVCVHWWKRSLNPSEPASRATHSQWFHSAFTSVV